LGIAKHVRALLSRLRDPERSSRQRIEVSERDNASPGARPPVPRKKRVSVEIVQEGDERFVRVTYDDGTVERRPVATAKPTRRPFRPHARVKIDHTKQKRF
jgi:hypothetical protein